LFAVLGKMSQNPDHKHLKGCEKKMTKDAAKKILKKEFQKAKHALMVLCIKGGEKEKRQKSPHGTMY
jgi:hypothetical protein